MPSSPLAGDASSDDRVVPPRDRPKKVWDRRFTGRTVIEVAVGLVSQSNFYAGLSMDLDTGGLFVATYQTCPVGTRMAVSLVLPGGHSLWAKGVVRWVFEPSDGDSVPGIGIEFTEIAPEDFAAIEAFCRLREPMYYEVDDR